ncbi:MAG: hypothetical protein RLZZ408_906 [Verrucomicrobiota bacterium]
MIKTDVSLQKSEFRCLQGLGPVKTKRQVAVPGVLLSGEAHKRGNTLAVLYLLGNKAWRQKYGTLRNR